MVIKYQVYNCDDRRIHQCDIFRNVPFYESYHERDGIFELSVLEFPHSIILTQECDLEQNTRERTNGLSEGVMKKHDKFLVSLLCAPLYNAEHLFSGNHLELLNITSEKKNSEQKKYIKSNREPRYHYIEFEGCMEIVPSVIDFKHYFSLSLHYLEGAIENRICSISPVFREAISQRFSNYLSRIGLPEKSDVLNVVAEPSGL